MYWLKMKWHEYWFFHYSRIYVAVPHRKEIEREMNFHGEMWDAYSSYSTKRSEAK